MMVSLREARAERLLSMRQLATKAGVASSTIYLIETGRSIPRLSSIRRIAAALGIEPTEIDEFRLAIERSKQRGVPPPRQEQDRQRQQARNG
jgi:transcriptional regulator with XRE-family HTH domain